MLTAGAGLLIGHTQSSPEQSPIMLPENPARMLVLPSAQEPPVTLAADKPAVQSAAAEASAKPTGGSPAARQLESVSPGNPQKQEVADEAANLLKMATALKTEVDKTTKDTLSVTVVRKAGEIEQLAHKVRMGPGKG
jgi:hypothetical protein